MASERATDPVLRHAWERQRVWSATAAAHKRGIATARVVVLSMTVAAAACGQLAQELREREAITAARTLGFASAATLLAIAYLSLALLGSGRVRCWIRARSLSEALKREYYLARAQVSPFRSQRAAQELLKRVENIEAQGTDLETIAVPASQVEAALTPLDIDQYIEERVVDQVDRFYRVRARQHQKTVSVLRGFVVVTTLLAVMLAGYGGISDGSLTGWVGVLSTASTALVAHLFAGHYQYLVVTYQNTAERLESLVADWRASAKTEHDRGARDNLINACEQVLAFQNQDWIVASVAE